MITLQTTEFLIATKARELIKDVSLIINLVPKKYYYHKNKLLNTSYDLLEKIYFINNIDYLDISSIAILQVDIDMVDFLISFFLDANLITKKQAEKVIFKLIEISKMTNVWLKHIREAHES